MLDHKIIYFMKVIEEGSFSAAARTLYLSQPALSKQITLLEEELNIKLLDRSHYRPVLTQAGEFYYQGVKDLAIKYDDLVNALHQTYQKHIKIAFTGLFENREAIQALRSFEKEFQSMNLSLVQCRFDDSLHKLLNKEVDISFGIESTFRYNQQIQYDILFQNDICVICSYDHPFSTLSKIDIQQLKSEKMIILSKKFGKTFYKDFMDSCKADHFKPHIYKEVDSFDELVSEVSIGNGIAIVSKDVVRTTDVKVIDLINSHHSSQYVVAYLKHDDPVFNALIDKIKHYFITL